MKLDGLTVVFSPELMEIEPRIRGRLLYRITMMDGDEGVLIFAGFTVMWRIHDFAGKRCLDIFME
jgi:hypothetical protein